MSEYIHEVTKITNVQIAEQVATKMLPKIISRVKCSESVAAGINWALYEIIDNAGNHGFEVYFIPINRSKSSLLRAVETSAISESCSVVANNDLNFLSLRSLSSSIFSSSDSCIMYLKT